MSFARRVESTVLNVAAPSFARDVRTAVPVGAVNRLYQRDTVNAPGYSTGIQ